MGMLVDSGWTWGRRVLLPLLAALMFIALAAPTARAVHDVSVFQLEGDAQVDVGETTHHDDWDVICEDNPTTCTIKAGFETGVTTVASSTSHENDGGLNASIFQGGGSKDIYGIGKWLWKDDAGGLPDKDNLLHAYAARYSVPTSTECPGENGNTDGSEDCHLIYFGSDRYDNNGDATQAFWFLQDEVTLGNVSKGGGFTFSGGHTDGDLLIISEFSNGGTTSTITIYQWTGSDATGSLAFLVGGENQKCGGSTPDPFCGIVNEGTTPIDSPWPFLDKGGSTQFRQGELFEAGINLSDPSIGLAGECFSSFVAETRSSTSTTAQLKDFVLGEFEVCEPEMTTEVSVSNIVPVLPGAAVTDDATITITGASTPEDPTGDVTFFLCGPLDPTDEGCPTGDGTNVGTGALVGGGDTSDGTATATSPTVNDADQSGDRGPLDPGRYCFRAVWPGDDNYSGISHTNNTTECFIVKDTTSISTAQKWLPQDTATISTGSGAAAPNGSVTFSLYENGTCTGTPAATFTDTSSPYETDNTSYYTTSTIISWSATFTPNNTDSFEGSTTTRCERSDLTINNSASDFPPGA